MSLPHLLRRIDRLAAGRQRDYRLIFTDAEQRFVGRALARVALVLGAAISVGALAVGAVLVLALAGEPPTGVVWMRSFVVLAMTVSLLYFAWRASDGWYWAYSRMRLFSLIFPVITVTTALIPGLYPDWMVLEQILFSALIVVAAVLLNAPALRAVFPAPPRRRAHTAQTGNAFTR